MKEQKTLIIFVLIALFLFTTGPSAFAERIIYVDDDANGLNDGSSWQNAYNFLQDALTATSGCGPRFYCEIRVARGIYRPDQGAN